MKRGNMINSQNTQSVENLETSLDRAQKDESIYTEVSIGKHSPYEKDVLSQFRANLTQLEDLHGRMKFLMKEVSSVIHKKY